jgi:hypothetical protein
MWRRKIGFADWNTTTFMVGTNMLIGGLLNVIVHRPGAAPAELPNDARARRPRPGKYNRQETPQYYPEVAKEPA